MASLTPEQVVTPKKPARVAKCLVCGKSPKGHLRPLEKNVALMAVYKEVCQTLLRDIPTDTIIFKNCHLCDTCVTFAKKLNDMRTSMLKNLELADQEHGQVIERHKRMLVDSPHSASVLLPRQKRPVKAKSLTFGEDTEHGYVAADVPHPLLEHVHETEADVDELKKVLCNLLKPDVLESADMFSVVETLMEVRSFKEAATKSVMITANQELQSISASSILKTPVVQVQASFLRSVLDEMRRSCPTVLKLLTTMAVPCHRDAKLSERVIACLYSVVQYSRNNHLSSLQRLVTASCIRYHAGNDLLDILHQLGIASPSSSKLPYLEKLGAENGQAVIQALAQGFLLKITVDNIDGRIITNQMRVDNRNRDYHYTHWTVLVENATEEDLNGLDEIPPTIPPGGPDPTSFLVNNDEKQDLRSLYKWMICKILVDDVPHLKFLQKFVPAIHPHKYMEIVNRKTAVHPMFVTSSSQPRSL